MAKISQATITIQWIDGIADALGYDVIDRAAWTRRVNEELMSILAPRLHLTEMEQQGIISPKKAPSDAWGTREVAQ